MDTIVLTRTEIKEELAFARSELDRGDIGATYDASVAESMASYMGGVVAALTWVSSTEGVSPVLGTLTATVGPQEMLAELDAAYPYDAREKVPPDGRPCSWYTGVVAGLGWVLGHTDVSPA